MAEVSGTASMWNSREWSPKQFSEVVVGREDFLARMPARGPALDVYPSWDKILGRAVPVSATSAQAFPTAPIPPPPGLENVQFPPGLSPLVDVAAPATPEDAAAADITWPPQDFQVLLRSLPESMCSKMMLRVMVEQISLGQYVLNIEIRPGGKCLFSFSTLEAACACIHHFHGRRWSPTSERVNALYVRKVARKAANAPSFNVDAPAFVPGRLSPAPTSVTTTEAQHERSVDVSLSADAPVFSPGMSCFKNIIDRDRLYSDATTASEYASEESVSDHDVALPLAA